MDYMACVRAEKDTPVVIQQSYNEFRSKHARERIWAVEGEEDPIFYRAMIAKASGDEEDPNFFICSGKSKVMDLLRQLKKIEDVRNTGQVAYCVDRDFDEVQQEEFLYTTDTYSIENFLLEQSILKTLLRREFSCNPEEEKEILTFYKKCRSTFENIMYEVNFAIFCKKKICKEKIATQKIEEQGEKFFTLTSSSGVKKTFNTKNLGKLVGGSGALCIRELEKCHPDLKRQFDMLTPRQERWRGKFEYYFLKCFLKALIQDAEIGKRGAGKRKFFSERKNHGFYITDKNSNMLLGTLSSLVKLPASFKKFYQGLPPI